MLRGLQILILIAIGAAGSISADELIPKVTINDSVIQQVDGAGRTSFTLTVETEDSTHVIGYQAPRITLGCFTGVRKWDAISEVILVTDCGSEHAADLPTPRVSVVNTALQATPPCGASERCSAGTAVLPISGTWSGEVVVRILTIEGVELSSHTWAIPLQGYGVIFPLIRTSLSSDYQVEVSLEDATGVIDKKVRRVTVVPPPDSYWIQGAEYTQWRDEYAFVADGTATPPASGCLWSVSKGTALAKAKTTQPTNFYYSTIGLWPYDFEVARFGGDSTCTSAASELPYTKVTVSNSPYS